MMFMAWTEVKTSPFWLQIIPVSNKKPDMNEMSIYLARFHPKHGG